MATFCVTDNIFLARVMLVVVVVVVMDRKKND